MSKPMVRIYTDAENYIDREMNAKEYAQWQLDVAAAEQELAARTAAEAKKQEVLAKLGLTADEVAALLA
jgi:hypothetical protein